MSTPNKVDDFSYSNPSEWGVWFGEDDASPSSSPSASPSQEEAASGIYSYLSSAVGAATQAAVSAVAYATLPLPGLYRDEIQTLQDALYKKTGANIAPEAARVISKRQVHKVIHHLSNVEKLGPKDAESGALKKFLNVTDGAVTINATGAIFLNVLVNHTKLVEETFELNILRAMNNGVTYLKDLQTKNSFFLVKLVQDAMKEVVIESSASKPPQSEIDVQEDHRQFMQKVQRILILALFPKKEKDIEIPISLQGWLNSTAFLKIQEEALPRKMTKLYSRAVSDVQKYKLLAKAVTSLKNILINAPEPKTPKTASESSVSKPYPEQEQFNQQLRDVASVFLDVVNSKTLRFFKPVITKAAAVQGPKIVEKIASIQFETLLNHSLKLVCKKLNPAGSWLHVEGKDVYNYVPTAPKTVQQKEEHSQVNLLHNQQVIASTVDTIAHDLSGLVDRLAPLKPSVAAKEGSETPFQSRLSRITHAVAQFFRAVRRACVHFLFAVFGVDRQIAKLSKMVIAFAEKVDLKRAANPIKRTIIQAEV